MLNVMWCNCRTRWFILQKHKQLSRKARQKCFFDWTICDDKNIKQLQSKVLLAFMICYCRISECLETDLTLPSIRSNMGSNSKKGRMLLWSDCNDEPNLRSQTAPCIAALCFVFAGT